MTDALTFIVDHLFARIYARVDAGHLNEADLIALRIAAWLERKAHRPEAPCSCTYYGPEPECQQHGQCAYEGHPGDRRGCHCGGRR